MSPYNNQPQQNSRRSPDRSYGSRHENRPSSITPSEPVKFYADADKKILNPELLDSLAEQEAQKINEKRLNSAQLRRFFGEVKDLYHIWRNNNKSKQSFERLFPLIKLMKSKVQYARNPKNRKIPDEFARFLLDRINQIEDEKDFEAFVLHFEAVVGFMYGKDMVSK